jgi:hypothetical protein
MSLLVALLVPALATACGGGTSGDQSAAERAVLQSSDLQGPGAGLDWYPGKRKLPGGYAQPADDESVVARCVNFDFRGLVVTGRAHSDWFSSSVGDVTSLAGVYEDPAGRALEQLAAETTRCMRRERASDAGLVGRATGRVSVREIPFPRIGKSSRAYEIESDVVEITSDVVRDSTIHENIVLIHKHRSVALLYFVGNLDRPFDRSLTVKLAEAVASHM